jgi:hypothetical protein
MAEHNYTEATRFRQAQVLVMLDIDPTSGMVL